MAAPYCSVCARADLSEIDEALVAGGKIIPLAQQYGLTKSTLGRHRTKCLAPKVAAAAKMLQPAVAAQPVRRAREIVAGAEPTMGELLTLEGLLAKLSRSLDRLETAADDAAGTGLHGALAAVSGQIHRGIESVAKLKGMYVEAAMPQRPSFSVVIQLPPEHMAQGAVIEATASLEHETHPTHDIDPTVDEPTNWNTSAVGFMFDD